jgi:hypothetical protein
MSTLEEAILMQRREAKDQISTHNEPINSVGDVSPPYCAIAIQLHHPEM